MSREATTAPPRLPKPPTTITTKASIRISWAIPGNVDRQRSCDHAGKTRQGRSKGENAHEDQRHVDSQRVGHLAVVHGRPQNDPQPGLVKNQGHDQADENAAKKDEYPVNGIGDPDDLHRAAEKPADIHGQRIISPVPFHQFRDDIGQSKGQKEFLHMAVDMDPAQKEPLDQCADDKKNDGAEHQGQPELIRESQKDGIGKIGAQHIHGGVGKVQDVHHPEYQRKARRNQETASPA